MRRASLQVKFGLSYILVIAAVLVFMNTYPLIVSENLVVRSKQTTLQSSVSVMVTALSGLEELSEENVASAMTLVEDTGISRILVTDAAGRILYDTRETDGAEKMQYMAEDPADLRNITPYYHNHQRVSDLHGVDDEILKIAILHHGGTAEHIYPRFAPYRADFSIAVSAFEWMDIMPKGVNKGVGVRMLQKHLGITKEETMAFGDFMNDLEMLQEAGYSVAMKNALPQIKAVCREETAYTNEEDGVIRWIRQWLKKGIE